MLRRELIRRIIAREKAERCGFWLGKPHSDMWPMLHRYFGTRTEEELRVKLGDDCRWICPQFYPDVYQDPQGRQIFDAGLDRSKHMAPPLACLSGQRSNFIRMAVLNRTSSLLESAAINYRMAGPSRPACVLRPRS